MIKKRQKQCKKLLSWARELYEVNQLRETRFREKRNHCLKQ